MPQLRKYKKKDGILYPKLLDANEVERLIYNDLPIISLYPKPKNPLKPLDSKYLLEGEESFIICDQGAVYSLTNYGRVISHSGKQINTIVYAYKQKGQLTGHYNFSVYTPCGVKYFEEFFEKAGWKYDARELLEVMEEKGTKLMYS